MRRSHHTVACAVNQLAFKNWCGFRCFVSLFVKFRCFWPHTDLPGMMDKVRTISKKTGSAYIPVLIDSTEMCTYILILQRIHYTATVPNSLVSPVSWALDECADVEPISREVFELLRSTRTTKSMGAHRKIDAPCVRCNTDAFDIRTQRCRLRA